MDKRKLVPLIILLLIAAGIIFALSSSIFFTIETGHVGVIFKKFGGGLDKDEIYREGFHVKMPWNILYTYEIRETTKEEQIDILDKNALEINVDVTARFRPMPERIGYIHERFGEDYVNKLVIPEIRSTVRRVMGQYTAEEIYSTRRADLESIIEEETRKTLQTDTNNIELIALLFRSIKLPDQIKSAIENKLQQEQEALAYQYRLDKERSEAERKRIAAEGEAEANRIINSSLTEELLKMRGIEATSELSHSENAKIIVIGSGKDGLPIILGNN